MMQRPTTAEAHLRSVGLRHVAVDDLAIRRRRSGKGFVYLDADGRRIEDRAELARIRALAIPPNYSDVRIAGDPRAHIQAIGQDDAGRTQYRYHREWDVARERSKVDRLAALSRSITRIRRRVVRDLASGDLTKTRALAAVIMAVDRTHIRIGCEDYVHSGRSRGAATLLKRNVRVDGDTVTFAFRGKGGRDVRCSVSAPALARAIGDLRCLRGTRQFQYRDQRGTVHPVSSSDANVYLNKIAGMAVTAKDFRTLAATATAAVRFARMTPERRQAPLRRQIASVMREVAELLGNTPTVTRKSYVHQRLVDAFAQGELGRLYARTRGSSGRTRGEALVEALFAGPEVAAAGRGAAGSGRMEQTATGERKSGRRQHDEQRPA